ncbi:hypothetical protein [Pedobacter kyonggii]|uniref:hypothetical protein n=1 Tax=Pedobacter kyonggii TaxID=1926871 RepID=UPI0013EF35DB|nr:hypothetical protein [Pedobacter kyonggii]
MGDAGKPGKDERAVGVPLTGRCCDVTGLKINRAVQTVPGFPVKEKCPVVLPDEITVE